MNINKTSAVVQDFKILTNLINKTITSNWAFYSQDNPSRNICEKGRVEVLIFHFYIILNWYKSEYSLKFEKFNKEVFSFLGNEIKKFCVNDDEFINSLIISRFKYFKFNLEQDQWDDCPGTPLRGETYYLFFKRPLSAKIIYLDKNNYMCKVDGYTSDMCTLWRTEDQYSSSVMTALHHYHDLVEELGASWDSFTPPLLDFKNQENNTPINQKKSNDNNKEMVITIEEFMNLGLLSKIEGKILAESKILNHISFVDFVLFSDNPHLSSRNFPEDWYGKLPETIILDEMLNFKHIQTLFFKHHNVQFSEDDNEKFKEFMIESILSSARGFNLGL